MKKTKIRALAVKYYGYHQGYKIYINGIKYPKAKGHFYATKDKKKAIKSALREKKTGKEQYY